MSNQIPIYDSEPETHEQIEEKQRLQAMFADMEKQQPAFLDEAGKSIIERVATFLAILFWVTAFGSSFPPPYLKINAWNRYLVIATLLCYLASLALGMLAIRPRSYTWHRYQSSTMAQTLKQLIAYKKRLVQWAGIVFAIGTLILAALIMGASLLMRVPSNFELFGYPGLAILCFLGAAGGGVWLVFSILWQDHKARRKSSAARMR